LERLLDFLPQIIVLFTIGVASIVASKILEKLWLKGIAKDKRKMIEWCKENKLKAAVGFIIGAYLYAPTVEELIFRAALIVIFPAISGYAWLGIILSGLAFGLLHAFDDYVKIFKTSLAVGNPKHENESVTEESKAKINGKVIRIYRGISTGGMGILIGYFGIKYQSLYLASAIHAGWNLLMPLFLLIVIGVTLSIAFGITILANRIKDWWLLRNFERKY